MAEQSKRIQFLQDALRKLAKAVREVSKSLIDLDGIISKVTGKTREFAKQQQKAAQELNRVGKNIKQTAKDVDEYSKKTEGANKSSKGFFGTLGKNLRTIVSFYGAYQILNVTISLFRELTFGAAKRAIELEAALAGLSAVAGLTSKEVERMKAIVFDVAGTTSLTTLEVVELQKELAKLGATASEIEGLTKPIAILSQTLGEDAGGVASSLKKTLNQFQATTDEAENFANVFTGAINETALSLNDLGTGLQYVGPLAKQLGLGIEETASLLGILADNGFKASRAGTGLRQFFITAAKDGRPFEDFLKDLSERTINISEATELFNKTGASQALVLLDNIERYKELSEELSDNNRLFRANAEVMSTVQGQLLILKSAYDNISASIGQAILNNRAFLSIIGVLDKRSAAIASSYVTVADATDVQKDKLDRLIESYRAYSDVIDVSKELTNIEKAQKALDILGGYSLEQRKDFFDSLRDELDKTGGDLDKALENLSPERFDFYESVTERAAQAVRGLLITSEQQAKTLDKAEISIQANNESVQSYNQSINDLRNSLIQGNDIDKEKIDLQNQIKASISQTQAELDDLNKKESSKQNQFQIDVLEKRIALYNEQIKSINRVYKEEDDISKEIEKLNKKRLKADLEGIQKSLESRLDSIEAITQTELTGAKNAEEAAQIRLKAEKLIQAEYRNSIIEINKLKDAYPEFAEEILNAAEKYELFAQFSQSAIGKEGVTILKDYKKQFDDLGNSLKNGEITIGEYEAQNDALEASLIGSIVTLKNNTEASEELKDMLDKIVVSYLNAKKGVEDYVESTKEAVETTKILGKTFVKDLTIEEAIGMSLATTGDIISKFNDTALENTRARLDAEKDLIANRYQVEQDILKSQLDNQLITESQYRQKQKELRKAQVAEENAIDKKIFEAQKKRDRQNATTGYLQALGAIIPNLIVYDKEANPIGLSIKAALSSALATAAYGSEIAAINQRKFVPKKFAEGGVVSGPSHSEGGVPFTVQGRSGYEMEGGEFIVNKRATAMHRDLLERINNSYRTKPQVGRMRFADGGFVNAPVNESVDYLKAIAEATTSTAIQSQKPVRAFVADKDLRTNANERRLRDRNDKI